MINKGKLLSFLYIFPPKQGTAALRNYNQINELGKSFDQKFIFTSGPITSPMEGFNIFNIPSFDYRKLSNKKSGGHSEQIKSSAFVRFFIKLINTYPFNLFIGEGGGYYIYKSINSAKKLIKAESITHIYSSYRPGYPQ